MSTQCLGQQVLENKTCLTDQELDYFISQDIKERGLEKDTALLSKKIVELNNQKSLFNKINQKNDSLLFLKNQQFETCSKREIELKNNLDKTTKIINRQRKVIGITGSSTAILILSLVLKLAIN